MKRVYWIILIWAIIAGLLAIRFIFGGGEDSWIKDSRGVYISHGNPSEMSNYVFEQQIVITCALRLYHSQKDERMQFLSQCLGRCGDYAVDIVNVPRNSTDDQKENQCSDYLEGKVSKFIELDKDGKVVRIS